MLRNYKLVSAGIVVFWLVMMGLLIQREVLVERAVPGSTTRAPFDTWMGVFTASPDGSEHQIGYVHSVSDRVTRDGVAGSEFALDFKLTTTLRSKPTDLSLQGRAWVPDMTGLSEFSFTMASSGGHKMTASGLIDGGRLLLEIGTAGDTFPIELPVGKDLLLSGSLGATTLNVPMLEVGDEVIIDAFDPVTFSSGVARVKCVGTETLIVGEEPVFTKILTTTVGGITTKTWVASNDEIVRVETPFGLILRKIPPETALLARGESPGVEMISNLAIQPTGLRPFRGARRMKARLSGYPPGTAPPSDNVQNEIESGLYLMEVPAVLSPNDEAKSDSDFFSDFLVGDAFVQVDHPLIVQQAADIVGDSVSQWEQARKLYDWTYENIEKTIVLSFPSALDVLKTKEGDCNEHTVLFTAMARSLNIPTRIAIGAVWSDELSGFYYHAWPEVFVGQWIPMDPTLGQEIADATHIKLLNGNIESWPRLLAYLGQLQVEVLEIQ